MNRFDAERAAWTIKALGLEIGDDAHSLALALSRDEGNDALELRLESIARFAAQIERTITKCRAAMKPEEATP